jgi:hypothetical protein
MMQQQQQQGLTPAQSASALDRAASSNTSFGSSSHVAGVGAGVSSGAGGLDQQAQQGSSAAAAAAATGSDVAPTSSSSVMPEPSSLKQQQLVSPTALPMPRMSNAFARKHGLDPKENPLVNLQRLAMQQMSPSAASMVGVLAVCCVCVLSHVVTCKAAAVAVFAMPNMCMCRLHGRCCSSRHCSSI